ncbi:hypothetical protein J1605_020604 [Eschrichtius robustus]|uniref:Uncharacterized protein n=1 Tax=Eschrichtius robustus TaxID=9764 RepID=A0AB34HGV7_ESCRO|nr:hypothetical protein J1605_020604 [Eschrichtius robustus]
MATRQSALGELRMEAGCPAIPQSVQIKQVSFLVTFMGLPLYALYNNTEDSVNDRLRLRSQEKRSQNPAEASMLPKCSAAEALSSLAACSLSRPGWELLQQLHPNKVERELVSL